MFRSEVRPYNRKTEKQPTTLGIMEGAVKLPSFDRFLSELELQMRKTFEESEMLKILSI
jgi:hypothetical protein